MFLRGTLLGVGAAAPIGPVNVEIARRTLRGGFAAGFALGCGAVTVDVAYAVLVSLTLRRIMVSPGLMTALGIGGAGLLAFLGIGCLRQKEDIGDSKFEISNFRSEISNFKLQIPASRHYLTGLLLTSLNPMTLAFWFLGVPATVSSLTPEPARDLPWVCAGVFAAALAWVVFFAGAMNKARGIGKKRWLKAADRVGGILLLSFALLTIWRTARGYIS